MIERGRRPARGRPARIGRLLARPWGSRPCLRPASLSLFRASWPPAHLAHARRATRDHRPDTRSPETRSLSGPWRLFAAGRAHRAHGTCMPMRATSCAGGPRRDRRFGDASVHSTQRWPLAEDGPSVAWEKVKAELGLRAPSGPTGSSCARRRGAAGWDFPGRPRRALLPRSTPWLVIPPSGVTKLRGHEGFHRIRVGDYRVVHAIEDDVLPVLVVRVGHRREVYRRPRSRSTG
jgi:hypothetical protein